MNDEENEESESDNPNTLKTRYRIGINAWSILPGDGAVNDMEEKALGNLVYISIISFLSTDREKFIALALDMGFEKREIASMLHLHPSQITRDTQKLRLKLKDYRNRK